MSEREKSTTRRQFLDYSTAALTGFMFSPSVRSLASPPSQATDGRERAGGELPFLTIAEAANWIESRQISPVELTQAVIQRIEALNPSVGAFITTTADHAMEAARNAEREIMQGNYRGPLHGIPYGSRILTTAKALERRRAATYCVTSIRSSMLRLSDA